MSMVRCEECERFIDSDEDPECFVEVGNMKRLHKEIILCEPCRERRWEEYEADAAQEGLAAQAAGAE